MNSPLIAVIIVITLIVGSALSIMNKACKSGHHAWCPQCRPCTIIVELSRLPRLRLPTRTTDLWRHLTCVKAPAASPRSPRCACASNPRPRDKASYEGISRLTTPRENLLRPEPDYCLT